MLFSGGKLQIWFPVMSPVMVLVGVVQLNLQNYFIATYQNLERWHCGWTRVLNQDFLQCCSLIEPSSSQPDPNCVSCIVVITSLLNYSSVLLPSLNKEALSGGLAVKTHFTWFSSFIIFRCMPNEPWTLVFLLLLNFFYFFMFLPLFFLCFSQLSCGCGL